MFETALEPDEIVTAVHFPKAEKSAYAKFRNPASRYAIVGVFVARIGGDGEGGGRGCGTRRLPLDRGGEGAGRQFRGRRPSTP